MIFNYIFRDTSGDPADPMDIIDIQESSCNNCHRKHRKHAHVLFVRLSNSKLIWWHEVPCTFHKKRKI